MSGMGGGRQIVAVIAIAIGVLGGIACALGQDATIAQEQEMLLWLGHYDGNVTGAPTDYTRNAIRKYQSAIGHTPTGQLNDSEHGRLVREGMAQKNEAGFRSVQDARARVRIGIPTALVQSTKGTPWGTNWVGKDDQINIDTLRFVGSPNLNQLYEKLTSIKGRKLRYSPLRPTWFVLEGEDKSGQQFYVRAVGNGSEVRAFSVSYDESFKQRAMPIALAMAASFLPFPDDGTESEKPPTVRPSPPQPPPSPPPAQHPPVQPRPSPPAVSDTGGDCFNGLGKACPSIASGR